MNTALYTRFSREGFFKTIGRTTIPTWFVQILRFSAVGLVNTFVDAGSYFVLTRWLGMALMPVIAKVISYLIGIINSYFWNRKWTFQSDGKIKRTAILFALAQIAALGINAGILGLCFRILHLPELISLGFATAGAFTWNFAISKMWVFKA